MPDNQNQKGTPNLIITLILTVITVITWISFSIYRALTKPGPVVVPPEVLTPLDSSLDLQDLEKRTKIENAELPEITIQPKSTSSPLPLAVPTPTSAPTETPTTEETLPESSPSE